MNVIELWKLVSESLKGKISNAAWNAFIKTLIPYKEEGEVFYLKAPLYIKDMVEVRYMEKISDQIKLISGKEYIVKILNDDEENHNEPPALKIISRSSDRYRFDNFIVGSSNQFAYAASVAVAESPGNTQYNPLFLYGDVGLGKTHLMRAVANYVKEQDESKNVAYITCERFVNELITAIRTKSNEKFREKYRRLDVLLIDDIQFITGKENTQDEFFHTFNALYNDGKQIIMASDRHPDEIKTLTRRLNSRFKSGIMLSINPPDFETRVAILQSKAEEQGVNIDGQILEYIASNVKSNIRELEGALKKVIAYEKFFMNNKPIDLKSAKEALKDIRNDSDYSELTIEKIQKAVSETCGVSIEDLTSKKRTKPLSTYRQIAEYLCMVHLKKVTLTEIAKKFGGQNHTSVSTAIKNIKGMLGSNDEITKLVEDIENKFIF